MVKKRTTTPHEPLPLCSTRSCGDESVGPASASLHQPVKRYAGRALAMAVAIGSLLIFTGHVSLGKGLVLGSIFSIINFVMMAAALPLRIGRARGASTIVSLCSIAVRYAVLAAPLVVAVRHPQYAITTTAIGLFAVQLVIVLDQAFKVRRSLAAAEE